MARKRISMKNIREIIRLKETTDRSEQQIARALKVARTVLARYLRDFSASGLSYEQIAQMADIELLKPLEKKKISENPKYGELVKLFLLFVKDLGRKSVTLHLFWKEYCEKQPEGYHYFQFCYHFQMWRNASEVTMHLEHKAGDKMFVDYAGDKLSIVNPITSAIQPVEVFVAVLGYSKKTYAEGTLSQKLEEWTGSNERAFRYYGGVTQAIVPDNLRSAVSYSNKYEPGINPTFDDFAEHYRTVIIPTRVREARDKGGVESDVKYVKGNFLKILAEF